MSSTATPSRPPATDLTARRGARVLFDFDGTLIDSVEGMARAGNQLLAEMGRAARIPAREYARFVGRGIRVQLTELLTETGGLPQDGFDGLLERLHEIYNADPVGGTVLFEGARAALEALVANGHALAIVTQKPCRPTEAILKGLGIRHLFAAVTCGDSFPFLKPDPRMVTLTAAEMPEGPAILVGDSPVDAATAKNAGIPFVLRTGGYDGGAEIGDAAARFEDFAALPDIIAGIVTAQDGTATVGASKAADWSGRPAS